MSEDDTKPISRRYFFETVGCGAIAAVAAGGGVWGWQFLSPNVLFEPPSSFKAGRPQDYPLGSVTLNPQQQVFIVREKEGYFYALSAICSHLGCIANWSAQEGIITCPCHGSRFARTGEVLAGPAPLPLQRLQIELSEGGELVVDKGTAVGEGQVLKL
jgi:cytochrome b6-f complex iron-sulfur subunit